MSKYSLNVGLLNKMKLKVIAVNKFYNITFNKHNRFDSLIYIWLTTKLNENITWGEIRINTKSNKCL